MLTEPIVEGAYYEREDGDIAGPARPVENGWRMGNTGGTYTSNGVSHWHVAPLTRRVYLVPTDPAEVVAELRRLEQVAMSVHEERKDDHQCVYYGEAHGFGAAADMVAQKLEAPS